MRGGERVEDRSSVPMAIASVSLSFFALSFRRADCLLV